MSQNAKPIEQCKSKLLKRTLKVYLNAKSEKLMPLTRVLKANYPVRPKHSSSSKCSGSSSAVPCSLLGLKDSGGQGTPEWDRSSDNVLSSESLSRNDDSLKNRNTLGQSHHMAERNFGLKSFGERSSDWHVPSQGVLEADAFIKDETPVIKKGEKQELRGLSLDKGVPIATQG
ncbi:hypothetical protein Ancab_003269 [Ancistrocladus abbreviatus]